MAKRGKDKKFKGERGVILCAKHGTPVELKPRGYGLYCPTCKEEQAPC